MRPVRKTLLADLAACPAPGAVARQPQPGPLLDDNEGRAVAGRARGRLKMPLVGDGDRDAVRTARFLHLRVRL